MIPSKISDRIDAILEKDRLTLVPNKKRSANIVSVKDGIITYKIFVKDFKCQCYNNSNELCDHVLFVLYSHFFLEPFVITFILFKDIKCKFLEYVQKNTNIDDLNIKLENDILNSLRRIECGICLSSLADKKYNYSLYECPTCHNSIHHKCMMAWQNKKNPDGSINGCIYCKTKN